VPEQRQSHTLADGRDMQLSMRGMALTEALVALLVVSASMLGTLWLHQQALATQRQLLLRNLAMGAAEDLAERMKLNAPQVALYAKAWGIWPAATSVDCAASPCTRAALAAWDLQQVKQHLLTDLPEGDVAVFATPANGWGVVVAWRDPHETYRTDATANTPACPSGMSCWRLIFRPDA
jgi:type IV pilus modification protein PilV